MALISQSVIEQIKQLNIVDIISPYVSLKRRGNTYVGLCPFHAEKTPSFTVFENRNNYKCYGCQSYGDSIKFIENIMGLDFQNAIVYICENFNVELKYENDGKGSQLLKPLKDLHEKIASFAKDQLYSAKGKEALNYLLGRGFNQDILERFDIGFLPPDISIASVTKDFSNDVLLGSGIFINTRQGLKSFFDNRILFPLRSYTGAYIGFSGRTMDPNERAKYKNSPETAIFSKRKELFNLHNAKDAMLKHKNCYIVEGYFDVMRMVEAGYDQTVAIMGTAFTKEQVNKLKNYVEEYNIILDGDSAGQKAMRDSLSVALDTNIYPYVAFLPKGEDPDTFIKNNGADEFEKLLSNREDLLLYIIKAERDKGTDVNKRFHRLDMVKQSLKKVKDVYRRQYYSEETSRLFGVDYSTLGNETMGQVKTVIRTVRNSNNLEYVCEKDFLCSLLFLPDESSFSLISDIDIDHFEDQEHKLIFKKIVELFEQSGSISTLINEPDLEPFMRDIFFREIDSEDIYLAAFENKIRIILNRTTKEYHKLQKRITEEQDPAIKMDLLKEWQAVLAHLSQLKTQLKTI